MKKSVILSLFLICALVFTSCKSEKKNAPKEEVVVTKSIKKAPFSLKFADHAIKWTAYKTTAKVPVNGKFDKVEIKGGGNGNSVKEAINGAEFSVKISSIFTSNKSRDYKIRKFFFQVMNDPELLSGKFVIENDTKGYTQLKMNGIEQNLPFTYTIEKNTFSMKSTMDINKWNAKNALESLNKACYDLHKGEDGVSKTWSEVALNISTTFK